MNQPTIIIIAGPNGAGKTTFAREFLLNEANCPVFINADLIAAGLSPFAPDKAAIQAGRLMLDAIDEHVARRASFALETTLSGLGYARKIPQWRSAGYRVELSFLALPNAEFAKGRVKERVTHGGHDIPDAVVYRRYHSGRKLFDSVYKGLVDEWSLYDSSGNFPVLVEWSGEERGPIKVEEHKPVYTPHIPANAGPRQRDALHALYRAAERAREIARQTGTKLVIARNGQMVRVDPWDSSEP